MLYRLSDLNTVQLGATVDYAILLTTHYTGNRRTMGKEALKTTMRGFSSISSLASSCRCRLRLSFTSSNLIVSTGAAPGRGTIMSMVLVVFFLPPPEAFGPADRKTTLRADFLKE